MIRTFTHLQVMWFHREHPRESPWSLSWVPVAWYEILAMILRLYHLSFKKNYKKNIVLNSKTQIVWDLFYFETTSIFFPYHKKNTISLATHSSNFWDVTAIRGTPPSLQSQYKLKHIASKSHNVTGRSPGVAPKVNIG